IAGLPQASRRVPLFWARNAIYHALRAFKIGTGDEVLAPAYICSAAIEPILAAGAKVALYDVERDASVDLQALEAAVSSRTRALVLVHYFGFPNDAAGVRALCDRHDLFLIEDCAHVQSGSVAGRALGTWGDASVFSWRKFFPLFDGGELILNRADCELNFQPAHESVLFTLRAAKNVLESSFAKPQIISTPPLGDSVETSNQSASSNGNAGTRRSGPLGVDNNSPTFQSDMVNFPMSRTSRFLLECADFPAAARARRENYKFLAEAMRDLAGVRPLFAELPESIVPYVFPAVFDAPDSHLPLRRAGIPAVSWEGVRHAMAGKREFPGAGFLYDHAVSLPVHQDLTRADLEAIVRTVRAVNAPAKAGTSTASA
ncbi:MAG TPA: DegT/DnrJ/EryC1/StrS family aminotransferase, partial [Candidatus Acidoferrales bacterium]|nr:DegT/DnrJ/EryC1/StrS family aminotransferase [Candidatus Acidoferrales bacterium]